MNSPSWVAVSVHSMTQTSSLQSCAPTVDPQVWESPQEGLRELLDLLAAVHDVTRRDDSQQRVV
jgi:hypothetical protein